MSRSPVGLFAAAFLFAASTQANAALITFEGQTNTIYTSPITRLGFEIGNPVGQEQHFHEITSTGFGLPNNGTGVLLNDRDTEIYVVASGGGTFSLTSVDVASSLNNFAGVGLNIFGFLANVQVASATVASLGSGYTTVLGSGFANIDRLVFDGTGGQGGFVLDNLNLDGAVASEVPEPSTFLLLGLGLAGGMALRRRQRR